MLEANGYELGYTGKPWGPGNWKDAGRERNPVGPGFNEHKVEEVPYTGIRPIDYSQNFEAFYNQKAQDKPFFFWFGCYEPHRIYEAGSGLKAGKTLADAVVPDFLPEDPISSEDILDYAVEIEWFDKHLGEILSFLEEKGELDNTLIVITADNGMPFPYAKANLNEYGTHLPLAICGPGIEGDRTVSDLVSLIDLAPTFLDLTGSQALQGIQGRSLAGLLTGMDDYTPRTYVLTGRERHTHARPDNLGYPARAIRTPEFLYINNLKPELWPAGNPPAELDEEEISNSDFKYMEGGYHDIDGSPSKSLILNGKDLPDRKQYFHLAVGKRPADELYDIRQDPACTRNLAEAPEYLEIKQRLKAQLHRLLTEQKDPRMLGNGDIFDSYPRFARMRQFPGFKERGQYNPAFQNP